MYLSNTTIYEVWLLNNRTDAAASALRACSDKFEQNCVWCYCYFPNPEIAGQAKAYAMLKEVYGNAFLERFKEGHQTTEDDQRPGRPSTSKTYDNVEKIGKLISEDRRLSIRGLAEITGIDKECARFCMDRSTCAKIVRKWSKLLTPRAKGVKNKHLR
ncbi:hypothetical protein NQ318_002014 [Aromia moschata]|uniref:Uncharacterized protein n=1 Tax=Aromia moschata TaxID=1265417 RepID=A0AAV8Z1V1_9CUCU|nr:hypothetical protein NQ318_002014 [Aromia moschata]